MTNDLRIADAPLLVDVSGEEKLPTGGYGNYSTTINQIADFTQLKWKLATEGYVNNEISVVTNKLNNHTQDKTNPHGVTKEQVGLGEVDNTADLDKPVSAYQQSAIDEKIAKTSIADNLTTNESNKVLSAKQGKVLQDNKSEKAVTKFSVKTKAELSTLVGTEIVYVDEVKGVYKVDSTSTSSGNGYSTILDSNDRRWVLQDKERYVEYFDVGKIPATYMTANSAGTGTFDLGDFRVGERQTLKGQGYATNFRNSTITATANQGQILDFRMYNSTDPTKYGVKDQLRTDGVQPYFCDFNRITIQNSNGIETLGIEQTINQVKVFAERASRVDYGIRCTRKSAGDDATSIDTSLNQVYIQGAKRGFTTGGAYHLVDGHFVWADNGMLVYGSDTATALPHQRVSFGLYLDNPYRNGMYFSGVNGSATYSPHFYQVGRYQEDATVEVSGLRLVNNSNNNLFCHPTFNTDDLTKVTSMVWIDPDAKNNVFISPNGSYKMHSASATRMRNQTVLAGTGSWAKHNNVMRQLRASSSGTVAVNAEVTLEFLSDYSFPGTAGSFNMLTFKGFLASRNSDGATGIANIYLVDCDNSTDYGATNTISWISRNTNVNWEIVGYSRSGAVISLTLKNIGKDSSQIGIELQRSVDAKGFHF